MSTLTGVQSDIELAVWHMIINLPKAVNRREGGGLHTRVYRWFYINGSTDRMLAIHIVLLNDVSM